MQKIDPPIPYLLGMTVLICFQIWTVKVTTLRGTSGSNSNFKEFTITSAKSISVCSSNSCSCSKSAITLDESDWTFSNAVNDYKQCKCPNSNNTLLLWLTMKSYFIQICRMLFDIGSHLISKISKLKLSWFFFFFFKPQQFRSSHLLP